jgi:hypothetical protein
MILCSIIYISLRRFALTAEMRNQQLRGAAMTYRFRFLNEMNRIVDVAEHPNCADDRNAEQIALDLLAKFNRHPTVEVWDGPRKVSRYIRSASG